ncbi:hypothetical protein PoB_003486700, partial [Plakobranchus ocellatus]
MRNRTVVFKGKRRERREGVKTEERRGRGAEGKDRTEERKRKEGEEVKERKQVKCEDEEERQMR